MLVTFFIIGPLVLKLVPLNSVNNARSDDVWYCSGWYWKIWRNIDWSSRTPSNFTIVFLILWLIMSDRESETADTTDPGSSLGNPSSFDSESDRNSLNSSDERMDVSSSHEELVVGAAPAGGAQRAASRPGAARGRARQRGAGGSLQLRYNVEVYGTNIFAACSAVQSKIICSISSSCSLWNKNHTNQKKVWLSKNISCV